MSLYVILRTVIFKVCIITKKELTSICISWHMVSLIKKKTKQKLPYLSTQSPPPHTLEKFWRLYGQVTFSSFPPYMMSKIHKKQNFVILSGMDLSRYTHTSFLPEYTLFQFCPDIHFLNENDIEK